METMPSSVPTFKLPIIPHPTSLFKTTPKVPPHPLPPHLSTKPNHSSFSTKPSTTSSSTFPTRPPLPPSPQPPRLITHRKPATGYAAALADIAISNNTIVAVGRDVKRLAKLLRNELVRGVLSDPSVADREKGEFLKEVIMAEKGKFDRHMVGLLKLLVEKGKLGMVGEVLGEFEAIYDELLCGTSRFLFQ